MTKKMELLTETETETSTIDNYAFITETWTYCYINFVYDHPFSGFRI